MQRAEESARAAREIRAEERTRVGLGELKVSCGEHVVLEAGPLRGAYAFAVFDSIAHIGGLYVSLEPGSPEGRPLDPALAIPVMVESIERMGGKRERLSFAATGTASFLELLSPTFAETGKKRPRRRRDVEASSISLHLGSGRVIIG